MEDFHLVQAGSFLVSAQKKLRLEAYLGTCVGLTIVDKKNKIGGLYHILLPEPPTPDTTYQLEVYALTGLPLFLSEIINKGAQKSRLEAVVAGGSLVAPAMPEDFYMNIGGRILNVVEDFLNTEGIPIAYSEAGGFFSCKMTLDLFTMETKVEPLGTLDPKELYPPFHLKEEDIKATILSLKPIPNVAIDILQMLKTGCYRIDLIASKVKKDQVLTAKILAFCNSPYIAPATHITSIDRAIVLLGEKNLLKVILACYCQTVLDCAVGGYSMCKGGLFRHSLITASISEALADVLKLNESEAYTAGLLHDIGKVVLDQHIHNVAPFFYRKVFLENKDIIEIERKYLGIDHNEAGKILATMWKLPEEIIEIIACHDDLNVMKEDNQLLKTVAFANIIASRFGIGNTISNVNLENQKICLSLPSLTIETFYKLLEIIVNVQKVI